MFALMVAACMQTSFSESGNAFGYSDCQLVGNASERFQSFADCEAGLRDIGQIWELDRDTYVFCVEITWMLDSPESGASGDALSER